MRAGIVRTKITPPVGIDLTGYIGRPGPSARIHDDLYATALILDDGSTRIGIVSLDILGMDFQQDAILRSAISQSSGIAPENLLIVSSHTHAGPATQFLRECGTPDESYVRWLYSTVKSTVKEASENMADASLSITKTTSNLGTNRRDWVLEQGKQQSKTSGVITDPEVTALIVEIDEKKPVVLFNYACHGVVMGADNVDISADWIGAARNTLEETPAVGTAMFLQGCCGNINPTYRGTFQEVKRAGEAVAFPLLEALSNSTKIEDPQIKVIWKIVELPFNPMPDIEEVEQEITFRREEISKQKAEGASKVAIGVNLAMLGWAEDALKAIENENAPSHISMPLQAISIGDVILAAIPGEVFCEIGLAIRKMANSTVIPVGYANGNVGYVPTAEAHIEGGYETHYAYKYYGLSMIAPESECIILQGMRELLTELVESQE